MIATLDDDVVAGIVAKFGPAVRRLNLSSNGLRGLGSVDKISPCLERLNLSRNDLLDLRPMQGLTTLTDLDLSENCISDLSPLTSLSRLERLDLSGNNIASLTALEPISRAHLGVLRVLNLQGNPICRSLGYPHPVLALLPGLAVLDGVRVADSLEAGAATSSPTAGGAPAGAIGSCESPGPAAETATALSLRLEALERAFDMQERALTGGGLEAARQAARVSGSAASAAWEGAMVIMREGEERGESGAGSDAAQLEAFPYLRLLQLWRHAALDSMTQLGAAQRRLQQALGSLKESRSQAGQASRAQQLTALAYREKAQADRDQAAFLQARTEALEAQRQQDLRYRAIVDRERQDSQVKLRALRAFLEQAQRQLEAEAMQAMLRVNQAARSLRAYEGRVAQASERLQLAAVLIAQREVVLRNSQAALEAQARMLAGPPDLESADEDKEGEREGEREGEGQDDEGGLLSDLAIRPEAESLLRAVFRSLDEGESGHVPRALLQSFLGLSGMEGVDEAERAVEAGVSSSLLEALGPQGAARLRDGLQAGAGPNVTWGELLLCLLPGAGQRLAALSGAEWEELRGAGLWGDAEWAAVPLALPRDQPGLSAGGAEAQSPASAAELRRLQTERRYLLGRLQAMGRSLERRAEAVKAHFAAALRRGGLREGRLQGQVSELRAGLEAAERRVHEASETHAGLHRAASERVAALEEQLAEARGVLAARRDDETRALEGSLQEERARYSRLETEHSLLQREMGKRDVRAKGLQRDAMLLQAQAARASEDKARAEAELAKEREDQAVEMRGVREAWAAERAALEARVAELELEMKRQAEAQAAQVSAAAAVPAAAPSVPATDGPSRDEFESVRRQMDVLRALPEGGGGGGPGQEHLRRTVAAGGAGQSEVYAAHLAKLLRLAEEAMGRP